MKNTTAGFYGKACNGATWIFLKLSFLWVGSFVFLWNLKLKGLQIFQSCVLCCLTGSQAWRRRRAARLQGKKAAQIDQTEIASFLCSVILGFQSVPWDSNGKDVAAMLTRSLNQDGGNGVTVSLCRVHLNPRKRMLLEFLEILWNEMKILRTHLTLLPSRALNFNFLFQSLTRDNIIQYGEFGNR